MKWTLLSALAWSALVLSKPANDWSKPCFNGECAYDLPQSSGNLGTLHLTGAAITDITPASGWVILDCDPHALEQEIRLVCSSHDLESAGCRHVFDSTGPVDKVVRLPESCSPSPFLRVASARIAEDTSIPYHAKDKVVKRDGLTPTVHVFRVDSKWSQVDVQKTGPVNFTFTASNFPDSNQIEARGTQFEWPSWMTDTVGTVASTVSNIVDHAQSASDAIHSTVENVKTAMGDAFHSAVDGAKTIIAGAPSAVVNAKAAVSDGIDEACKHATDQSIAGIDDIKAEFNKFQADMEKVRAEHERLRDECYQELKLQLGALKDKLINFAEHTWDTIKPLIDDISREHARLRGINQHIEDQLNQDLRALEEKLLSFFMSKVAPQAHLVSDAALSVYNDIKIMAEKVRHDLDTLREVNKLYNDHLEKILKNCGQKLVSLGNTAMHYIQPALDNAKATLTDAFHQLNEIREMHKQHNEMIMKAMIDSARPTFDALLSAYNDVKTMLANKVQDFREANTIHYPQSNISKEVYFNQTEDTVIVSFRGPNFIPCKDNLFQPSLTVLARGQMDATANIEVNTTGSLIPPMMTQHSYHGVINADVNLNLHVNATLEGHFESERTQLFHMDITPLQIPGIISFGPAIQLETQVGIDPKLSVAFNTSVHSKIRELEFWYPSQDHDIRAKSIDFSPESFHLSAPVNISAEVAFTGHLIPSLPIGITLGQGHVLSATWTPEADIYLKGALRGEISVGFQRRSPLRIDPSALEPRTVVPGSFKGCFALGAGVALRSNLVFQLLKYQKDVKFRAFDYCDAPVLPIYKYCWNGGEDFNMGSGLDKLLKYQHGDRFIDKIPITGICAPKSKVPKSLASIKNFGQDQFSLMSAITRAR